LFCFHQKKGIVDAHRIICEMYENIIAIKTCANNLNDLKITDFNISDKKCSRRPAVMEEDKLRKDGKKSWKTMENISINLYYGFFIVIKKKIAKNQQLLH